MSYAFAPKFGVRVSKVAKEWDTIMDPPREVILAWRRLVGKGRRPRNWNWKRDVIFLLVVADTTCQGMDGDILFEGENSLYASVTFEDLRLFHEKKKAKRFLPHLPKSICWRVPPSYCCVQPKTNTPSVGCTLRSLSHHLALLPPEGIVETSWLVAAPDQAPSDQFNVLLIPFPFQITASDFIPNEKSDNFHRFFSIRQSWLTHNGRPLGMKSSPVLSQR